MNFFPIGRHISLVYRAQQIFFAQKTQTVDISGGQLSFVFSLYGNPGCSQDEVAKNLELDKTTVTRAVSKMEKSGIITRKRDEHDHRIIRLYLTEKGNILHDELKNVSKEWFDTLIKGMSEQDVNELIRLLMIVSENARLFKSECCDEKETR